MSTMRPASAKIIQHSEGMGLPAAADVRKRAEELARIDGRSEYNDGDWHDAKRELHGGHESNSNNGHAEISVLVSEHDMTQSDIGHHVENMLPEDNENMVEELIAEGMDEATHEQMLAARGEEPVDDEE